MSDKTKLGEILEEMNYKMHKVWVGLQPIDYSLLEA
jgi:hypothetical protein